MPVGLLRTAGALVLALAAMPAVPAAAADPPSVVIDSSESSPGVIRLTGRFTGAYDVNVVVNGERIERARVSDPDADDIGTWSYDLDTSGMDGEVEVYAKATAADTRYGTWSEPLTLRVDNPRARAPEVSIAEPADGARLTRPALVRVNVAGADVRTVRIRVNGGPWQRAAGARGRYVALVNPAKYGDVMASLEAEAVDARGHVSRSPSTYVALGAAKKERPVAHRQDRAMWMWEKASYNLVLNPGSRRLLETVLAPGSTLYLGVDTYAGRDMIDDARPELRDLVAWAHRRGMKVHATVAAGTRPPYLGALARYRDRAVREMERVLDYNLSSAPAERFDGINVDIEPYSLPWFNSAKPDVQIQWLDTLRAMIARRDASGQPLLFGPAIPRWLDTSACCTDIAYGGKTATMAEHIQDMADYVAIMDYRDQADGGAGIIAQAAGEIAYAERLGRPLSVVVGVETLDIATSGDPSSITFREEGRDALEAELAKVYQAFSGSPAFAGVALHHYDSYRELPTIWGPSARWPEPPADSGPPTGVGSPPEAVAFDHATVDLSYGRAHDDTEVDHYEVHRSTEPGFTPGPGTLAGRARGLTYTDTGLLPGTRYTYRIVPVDVAGHRGPASGPVSVTTGTTDLRPMVVDSMAVTVEGGVARVRLRVVDKESGEPVAATVRGRFTFSAGRYVTVKAGADGWATATSEALKQPTGEVGFAGHRLTAPGRYWAGAYDKDRSVTARW
ncbi:fibronectin type III domain-containing protein [Microbispora sp. GKU 823]|uniref:fibronectin type III domain-containing protein n=1 Tax=Microbispora sp. GKU 823 TaxID=1652100 RepID=UPI00117FF7B0|nr:fibronectin type III domain-containing protein [Microbispora sp. GKU 823]